MMLMLFWHGVVWSNIGNNTKVIKNDVLDNEYLTQLRRKLMKNQVKESMGSMSKHEFKEFLEQKKLRGTMQSKK